MSYLGLLHSLVVTIIPALPVLNRPSSPYRQPEAQSLNDLHLLQPPFIDSIRAEDV